MGTLRGASETDVKETTRLLKIRRPFPDRQYLCVLLSRRALDWGATSEDRMG